MASLSPSELTKRNNFSLFLARIRAGQEFTLSNAGGKKIRLNKSILTKLKKITDFDKFKVGQSIILPTANSGTVKLTEIYKDSIFSGRTQSTTAAEDAEVKDLNEQLEKIKQKEGVDFVKVKVGKNVYNVTSVVSTPGTPKSDFSFLDVNGNRVGHISHKDGTNPRGFQQWAGTSQRVEPLIYGHPETQDFINTLKNMFPDGMPPATTVGRKIKDNTLKNLAVYGSGFGGSPGINNVDLTVQGKMTLKKRGPLYEVSGSSHENVNGSKIDGGYEPIFLAVYKGDRSDHGIKSARITINPIGGRTVKQFV